LHLTAVGKRLYFTVDDRVHGNELWVTDGTQAGTQLASDLTPGSEGTSFQWLAGAPHGLYFATYAPGNYANHLWFEESVAPIELGRLVNVSTRARVLDGDNVLIAGFIIGGNANKTVLIRARGPSLRSAGVADALDNPTMTLYDSDGTQIRANDDWRAAENHLAIDWSGQAPPDPRESGILINLAPGAYTAVVTGVGASAGIALVEVFELGQPEVPLSNISGRALVQSGDNVAIGGFIIQGDGPKTVLIRGRGPSLAAFGIANTLANPHLQLVRADRTVIAMNDDWQQATNRDAIAASGFAPSDGAESALLVTLDPGGYTMILSGVGGISGVGIVEVFAIPGG
jgi:ELWxxDGT repeat protein